MLHLWGQRWAALKELGVQERESDKQTYTCAKHRRESSTVRLWLGQIGDVSWEARKEWSWVECVEGGLESTEQRRGAPGASWTSAEDGGSEWLERKASGRRSGWGMLLNERQEEADQAKGGGVSWRQGGVTYKIYSREKQSTFVFRPIAGTTKGSIGWRCMRLGAGSRRSDTWSLLFLDSSLGRDDN